MTTLGIMLHCVFLGHLHLRAGDAFRSCCHDIGRHSFAHSSHTPFATHSRSRKPAHAKHGAAPSPAPSVVSLIGVRRSWRGFSRRAIRKSPHGAWCDRRPYCTHRPAKHLNSLSESAGGSVQTVGRAMGNTTSVRSERDPLQQVLSRLQASLGCRLAALRHTLKPEGVHETRISIRRLRIALRAVKPQLKPPKRYLSALRRVAGDLEAAREAVARELAVKALINRNLNADDPQVRALLAVLAEERARSRDKLNKLIATSHWRQRIAQLRRYSSQRMIKKNRGHSCLVICNVLTLRRRRLRRALHHVGRKPLEEAASSPRRVSRLYHCSPQQAHTKQPCCRRSCPLDLPHA